jgi:hypothetical protein
MKRNLFILIGIFLLFSMISFSFAEEISAEEKAKLCLNNSRAIIDELNNSDFCVQRASDIWKKADNTFYSQKILKEKGRDYNFSLVLPFCNEMEILKENAFDSRDSFIALMKFYNETLDKSINTLSVDKIIEDIRKEITNERYEFVPNLINSAYEEILKVKSENTSLKVFYASTTKGLGDFFKNNLTFFIILFSILFFIFIFYKTALIRFELKRKITRLEWRRESLRELIKKAQKDYFEKGMISEADYAVRAQNFAEMIRDIDRQIPLLKEELAKISKSKKEEKSPENVGMIGKKLNGKSKKIENLSKKSLIKNKKKLNKKK